MAQVSAHNTIDFSMDINIMDNNNKLGHVQQR